MRFVTSFTQALVEKYAWRLLETRQHLPGELHVYTEDKAVSSGDGIVAHDLHKLCPKLVQFKTKLRNFHATGFRNDVVKFSNKVFAQAHALWNASEIVCWIDADCVILKPIPESFLVGLLKGGYCGYFGRNGNAPYTETGFLIFDPRKEQNQRFVNAYRDVYLSGRIFALPQWHDCYAFDEARKNFGEFRSLSIDPGVMHPIVASPLGEYIDHLKGPRKNVGYSEEHPLRWWKGRAVLGVRPGRDHREPAPPAS